MLTRDNEVEVYWIGELRIDAKFSNRANDDYKVLKFKDFQGLLHQIPKLPRPYSVFKDFPAPGIIEKFSRKCGQPVLSLTAQNAGYESTKRLK